MQHPNSLTGFTIVVLLGAVIADAQNTTVTIVQKPDTSQSNPYYPGNRPPLLASLFIIGFAGMHPCLPVR